MGHSEPSEASPERSEGAVLAKNPTRKCRPERSEGSHKISREILREYPQDDGWGRQILRSLYSLRMTTKAYFGDLDYIFMENREIAEKLNRIADLLEVKGEKEIYKIRAYRNGALALENLEEDIKIIYKEKGLKGLEKITGIGKSIAQKIEEYLKKKRIKLLDELEQETAIRQVIAYFFESKGLDLKQLKENAKKRTIVYSRYTKPAKQLIELSGGVLEAKKAIEKVALWASSRNLDYTIETVFKKWLEIDKLKPKEVVKKPFYEGLPMVFSETKKKWFVINDNGEWLEFADKEDKIEWKVIK